MYTEPPIPPESPHASRIAEILEGADRVVAVSTHLLGMRTLGGPLNLMDWEIAPDTAYWRRRRARMAAETARRKRPAATARP